jgi:hypothetical protein
MFRVRTFSFIAGWLISFSLSGQTGDYVMFESRNLDPLPGQYTELREAVISHDNLFHQDGNRKAYLFEILTGPRSGGFFWEMGPLTYTDLDETRAPEDHVHWDVEVARLAAKVHRHQLWMRDEQAGYNPAGQVTANQLILRTTRLKPHGSLREVLDVFEKISLSMQEMGSTQARRVYVAEFRTLHGEDIMEVFPFTSWTDLEDAKGLPKGWEESFEKLYGEGSVEEMVHQVLAVHTDGYYDEILIAVPH